MKKISIIISVLIFWVMYLNIGETPSVTPPIIEAPITYKVYINNITATVYNAHPSQCNADCFTTASGFKLDPKNPEKDNIIAIERTMMDRYGLKMGDVVYIKGAGEMDGLWRIEDKMNKRFKGQNRIDFLVGHTRKTGKWDNVILYII